MATFRNAQIEDILNTERTMNRVILDRTSAHISAIGDERAPPTTRDIKNEALLGSQVDTIKELINKSIQLISGLQFGSLDEDKIERLNKLSAKNQASLPTYILEQEQIKADKEKQEFNEEQEQEEEDGEEEEEEEEDGEDDNVLGPQY